MNRFKILTIESTCDETAAAVIDQDRTVLGEVVASQETFHSRFGGVVPEIAARMHVQAILPVIQTVLNRSNCKISDIAAVAVCNTPGLSGSLVVGLTAAKSIALAQQIPLITIHHLQAHIYACRMEAGRDIYPCVGLTVSGGHSNFHRCDSALNFESIGGTIDDAAGEAFDKVAAMLGLEFPGGPAISRLAKDGNPKAFRFPRPFLNEPDQIRFSFSGLKTAVRYQLYGHGNPIGDPKTLPKKLIADVAASFQQAVVDCIVGKSLQALRKTGLKTLCVGGGVAANHLLREQLESAIKDEEATLWIASSNLCTDNAAMGAIAVEKYLAEDFSDLDVDIYPGLERPTSRG